MGSELIVSGINNLLPALTSGGAQAATNALAPIATKAITPAVQQGLQGLLGKQIPVVSVESGVASIPINKTEMVDLFRGISAKTDDELSSYIRDMVDKNITPSTHGGGNFSGEGYNFSIGKDGAEYFAMRKPMEESRAILKTSVPKDRFIHQNAQNQNRLVDFVQRAEKRGVPVGQAAQEQGKRDMQRYFEKNGILGVKSPEDTVYVINNHDNDWTDNLNVESALRGRREIEPDEELLNKLQTYLGKPSAERQIIVQQDNYIPLYHQTSANSLEDFSLSKRGAGRGDTIMPEGIFLKETDKDIGLAGKNQLQLDAKLNNPLIVEDRHDLEQKLLKMNPSIKKYLLSDIEADRYYQKLSDEAEAKYKESYEKYYYDKTPANKKAFKAAEKEWKTVIDEWVNRGRNNAADSQKTIKKVLQKNGYDGMIMNRDEGSFGRSIKSYLVLDKDQLRDNSVPINFGKEKK